MLSNIAVQLYHFTRITYVEHDPPLDPHLDRDSKSIMNNIIENLLIPRSFQFQSLNVEVEPQEVECVKSRALSGTSTFNEGS